MHFKNGAPRQERNVQYETECLKVFILFAVPFFYIEYTDPQSGKRLARYIIYGYT